MLRPHVVLFGSLALLSAFSASCTHLRADQTVVVVLDDSRSMERPMQTGQPRIVAAKQALTAVLQSLKSDTQVGILALNSKVNGSHWIVPVGEPTPARWQQPLAHVQASGGTPLGEFTRQAADELLALRAKHPFSTYRLLVVTDGEASDAPLLNSILPDMLSRGITLDVIGVDMQSDHSLARSAHSYRRAGDQAALAQALTEVFGETIDEGRSTQADFEMLAGLSDETAAAIVNGLTAQRNEPLKIVHVEAGSPGATTRPVGALPAGGPRVGKTIFGTLCCLGAFGATALLAAMAFLSANKARSRKR